MRKRTKIELPSSSTSQQCDLTAKNAKIILATSNRSAVSRTRGLQLYVFSPSFASGAGHHRSGVIRSVSGRNKSNSRKRRDRNGESPRKQNLKAEELRPLDWKSYVLEER